MKLILASASPRRKELLKEIIPVFEIIPAQFEEKADNTLSPQDAVKKIAFSKAKDVFARTGEMVLSADTIVFFQGEILGKPKDKKQAKEMLQKLSANTHSVFTGICLMTKEKTLCYAEESKVTFYPLSESFIDNYIQSGSPLDKAGAYGIQDGKIVEKYTGSYTNIVGLPLERLKKMLKEIQSD